MRQDSMKDLGFKTPWGGRQLSGFYVMARGARAEAKDQ